MEGEQETASELSNGTSFNDLEWPQTQISRSGLSLVLNISEMAKDTRGHSYYERRIGNRAQAFKWYYFH